MKKFSALLFFIVFTTVAFLPVGLAAEEGGTLVVGLEAEPTSLDPHQISDYNSGRATTPMFDTLTMFKTGSTDIKPGLAKSWEVSDDGKTYTFNLREGIKFHNGEELTADVVEFNVSMQINEDHPYSDIGNWVYAEITYGMVESVEAVDKYTVKFNLEYPYAPFLRNLAIDSAAIISEEAIKKYEEEIVRHPVGTGPFELEKWNPGSQLVLKRNDNYWGSPANIEKLIFRPIVDQQSRLLALEGGDIDMLVNPPPQDVSRMDESEKYKVHKFLGQHVWWLSFNCQVEPFDNKKVRQAVHYAIDKESIVENILSDTGIVAHNPLPPNVWSYTDDVKKYGYNPEKARELLAEAGYPKGFEVDFWIPDSGSGMQKPSEMSTAIQSYLAMVGIKADIQTFEWGTFLEKITVEDPEKVAPLHILSWIMDNGDPDNILYVLFSSEAWPQAGYNTGFYKNEEFDKLVKEARMETDREKRKQLYQEAQKIVAEDSPWVWVDHAYEVFISDAGVENLEFQPAQARLIFKDVVLN